MNAVSALPEDVVETIKERLRRGDWTHLQIAQDLGVSRHTVARIARIHGLSTNRPVRQPPRSSKRSVRPADLEWMDRGSCISVGPGFGKLEVFKQKQICKDCEVRLQCVEFGLGMDLVFIRDEPVHDEVFGGLAPAELARLKRERGQAS